MKSARKEDRVGSVVIGKFVDIVNRIELEDDRMFVDTMFVEKGEVERGKKDEEFRRVFFKTGGFIVISVIFAEVENGEITEKGSDERNIMSIRG